MLGSFTEELVNRTIDWYWNNDVAFFKKSHVPVTFKENSLFFKDKADIDYYGVFEGKYISFEVKETDKDFFLVSQIKNHQKEILFAIDRYGAVSFLLLNFNSYEDSVFLITISELKTLFESNIKKISRKKASEIGINVPISFPGIIDWLSALGLRKQKL